MIGKIVGLLIGRKVKEKIIDTALDQVNLPDPIETAIKIATTGNVGDLVGQSIKKPRASRKGINKK